MPVIICDDDLTPDMVAELLRAATRAGDLGLKGRGLLATVGFMALDASRDGTGPGRYVLVDAITRGGPDGETAVTSAITDLILAGFFTRGEPLPASGLGRRVTGYRMLARPTPPP